MSAIWTMGLSAALAAGCTGGATAPSDALASVGVTALEVTETSTELSILGRNDKGIVAAELLLQLGYVSIPEEQIEGDGRILSIRVNDSHADHRSVGSSKLVLPRLNNDEMDAFLLDLQVSAALAKRGVTFSAAPTHGAASTDRAYDTCTSAPNSSCGATGCFEWVYNSVTYEDLCCASTEAFVNRSCNGVSGGTSACGHNGTGGCAQCWATDLSGPNYFCNVYSDGNNTSMCHPTGYGYWCNQDSDCCSNSCSVWNPDYYDWDCG